MTFRRCSSLIIIILALLAAPRSQPGYAQGAAAPAADCPADCLYLPLVNAPPDLAIIAQDYQSAHPIYGQYIGAFVANHGNSLTNVVVEIQAWNGNTLAFTQVATPVFSATLPGMHNVFATNYFTNFPTRHTFTTVVRSYDVVTQTNALMLPVTKMDLTWTPFETIVRGAVRNTSEFPVTNVRVLIELDGPGSLSRIIEIGDLAPGAIAPYQATIPFQYGTNTGPTNLMIQSQGLIVRPRPNQ
jgi:hypothetical protein